MAVGANCTYSFHGAPPILPLDYPMQRRHEALRAGGSQMRPLEQ
jgi:hypothetical protein